jgi:AcrR family transcriptional regulator
VISSVRLLEVAREVFLEHGFRATTLEVARRAGIAEGTIFHRFKSKAELFRAAMRFDPEEVLAFLERLPARAGQAELRQTLQDFAEEFLRLGRVAVPVMMMSWSNPDTDPCSDDGKERGQRHRRALGAVTAFFEAEMCLERIRRMNPEVLARMLLGSLHQFCMSELFSGRDTGPLSLSEFASEVVDVLLAATRCEAPAPRRTKMGSPGGRIRK